MAYVKARQRFYTPRIEMQVEYRYFSKKDYTATIGEPSPALEVSLNKASTLNSCNYGIFLCPNIFKGERRLKENLTKIQEYYVDIDNLGKNVQMDLIKKGLTPSWIVESKNGYHLHFYVSNGKLTSWYKIASRLIEFYQADKICKNPTGLLRVPGFYHCKDPNDKFMVKEVSKSGKVYTEEDLLFFYPRSQNEIDEIRKKAEVRREFKTLGDGLFEKIYNLDCQDALLRFSGHQALGGETISFIDHRDGTHQICHNGKSTSSWVDKEGRIGSHDRGCPTIWQYIRWYGYNDKEIYQFIKEVMPGLWK